ncbi:Selenide, water dikinase [bacterium HR17]|uniref:Selenide, water dikinase n=1 Tax=Candidatus Fervidibacter japonicus TaxID=2035412 RepID=A0A2H5X913_9BACT|nr:Selenide, water dikinase [bacterium HR17]
MQALPKVPNPNVLVGIDTADDAGVYRLRDDLAIVQTLDFITPIVDDPFAFGAIAAANAVSDIYAMGATPVTALNILGYPAGEVEPELVATILQGGYDKLTEAGIAVIGGHTVDDPVLKYGVAVTGIVHPDRTVTNAGAKVGDALVLTKPLGTGVINQGIKANRTPPEVVERAVEVMATLNKNAAEAMTQVGVNACTDVTGFGLLGHLREMLVASGVSARLFAGQVPLIDGVLTLAEQNLFPGGSRFNRRFVEPFVHWHEQVPEPVRMLLCDAQTSGGLLISVARDKLSDLLNALKERGVRWAAVIGEITANSVGEVWVEP